MAVVVRHARKALYLVALCARPGSAWRLEWGPRKLALILEPDSFAASMALGFGKFEDAPQMGEKGS